MSVHEGSYDESGRFVPADPDVSDLETDDGEPVDSIHAGLQRNLLVTSLHASWKPGIDYFAAANVAIYPKPEPDPLVPDMFLSLNARVPQDMTDPRNHCYFVWRFGKPPDVIVEVVASDCDGELSYKREQYARMGVSHYMVFDPHRLIQQDQLSAWSLRVSGKAYRNEAMRFEDIGLAAKLWEGSHSGMKGVWMRWTDLNGNMLLNWEERNASPHDEIQRESTPWREETAAAPPKPSQRKINRLVKERKDCILEI